MKRLLPLVAALVLLAPAARAADEKPMGAQERYDQCQKLIKRSNWTKALEECQKVRNYHRDDPLSVKAELAVAEIAFKKGDYEQARAYYEDFARLHPNHPDLDEVIYKTGLSIYKNAPKAAGRDQTQTRAAVTTWTAFAARFPDSEHGAEVAELLTGSRERLARKELFVAKYYEKREAWGAVQGRVRDVLKRYPDSELVPEAMALGVVAYHAWGMDVEAAALRERLATEHPDSKLLAEADRALEKPAGVRPTDEVFRRPYRLGGGVAAMGM